MSKSHCMTEKLWKTVHEASPFGINFLDKDLKIIDCNEASYRGIFGFSSKEEYVKNMHLTLPEYQPDGTLSNKKVAESFKTMFENGSHTYEWMILDSNRVPVPLKVTAVLSQQEDEEIIIVYMQDLRSLKESAKKLSELSRYHNKLLNNSPMIIETWDEFGNMINCNQKMLDVFNVSTEKEMLKLFYEFSAPIQPCGSPAVEKNWEMLELAKENGRCRSEWLFILPNGEEMPVDTTWVHINHGNTSLFIAYSHDLRPLRAADEKIRATEKSNQLLIEAMQEQERIQKIDSQVKSVMDTLPIVMSLWDLNSNMLFCNQAIVPLLGLSNVAEYKERFLELTPEFQPCGTNSVEKIVTVTQDVMHEKRIIWEWVHVDTSGNLVNMELTSILGEYNNEPAIYVFALDKREIVEGRRQIEAAEENSRAKSRFLANMSHEIRTPMNSIVGFSELALEDEMSPKVRTYLNKIIENSKWLLQIINDILDISKIESGKMELENIPFDVVDIFSKCKASISPKALEKNLKLHFYVEPLADKLLLGDPVRLRQILVNIISNAVKFADTGLIRVSSVIKDVTPDSMTWHCWVEDSGIGMTPEQLENIFDAFSQADATITRRFGGTGLGLSIVNSLLNMMGGTLNITSELGIGTTVSFQVTLQTINVPKTLKKPQNNLDTIEKPNLEGKILICEDNEMNQMVIGEHLRRLMLDYTIVENGQIGVDMVRERVNNGQEPYDLILMDIHMPVMDGLEASKRIGELNTNTPIVAMTANVMTEDRDIYRQLGIQDCVSKPFTSQELWACLLKYLKRLD